MAIVHAPLPLAAPPSEEPPPDAAVVQVIDMDVSAPVDMLIEPPPPPRATPIPTTRVGRPRRKVAVLAIVGGAMIGVIGAALALNFRSPSETAPPDAAIQVAALDHPHHDLPAAAAPPDAAVLAPDAAAAAASASDSDPDPDPVPVPDHHHAHHHHDTPAVVAPPPPPPADTATTAKSLYKEGLQKFVSGDSAGAISLFDQARAKDGKYAPAYRGLGMAYEKKGDAHRAARAFETYLQLAPNASDAASIRDRLEKLK
jgi:hypothetical protein